MCVNSIEFIGKYHACKKEALKDTGVTTGNRFYTNFRTVFFLCAVDPEAVQKVANKILGAFGDDPQGVGE